MNTLVNLSQEDLPRWMRRARRGVDYGVLIVLLLSVTAAWPFIAHPSLSAVNEQYTYVHRAADAARSLEEGRLYPRWSSPALYGFGAPIPHFTPPFPSVAAAIIQFVFTGDSITAVRVLFISAFIAAGLGTYALVLRRVHASAGVIAAAIFLFSPVLLLTTPHILGNLAWMLAFGLAPVCLWSVDRLLSGAAAFDPIVCALTAAGMMLTHPGTAIATLWVAAAYTVWLWLSRKIERRQIGWLILSISFGIGAAAPYWLPAVIEYDAVTWLPPLRPLASPSLQDLLWPPLPLPPDILNPAPEFSLGWGGLFGLFAGGWSLVGIRKHRFTWGGLWLMIAIGSIFAVLLLPDTAWLAGLLALIGALASASVVPVWAHDRVGHGSRLTVLILAGVCAVSWPMQPRPATSVSPIITTPEEQVRVQVTGGGTPFITLREAAPITLPTPIQPDQRLLAAYSAGLRAFADTSSVTAVITPLEQAGHFQRYQIQTGDPTQLRLLTAPFPGWRATLSGVELPIASNDDGLIVINLPPVSNGELLVTLGDTPARSAAWVIALLSITGMAAAAMRRLSSIRDRDPLEPALLDRRLALAFAAIAVIVFAAQIVTDITAEPSGAPPEIPATAARVDALSPTGIALMGASTASSTHLSAPAPGHINLTLYWSMTEPQSQNFVAHAFLVRLDDGTRWAFTSAGAPGSLPFTRWSPGAVVIDERRLTLPEDVPTGSYTIGVELFTCGVTCEPETRVSFTQGDQALGRTLILPYVIAINTDQ